jgi:hypothetical protein
MVNGREQIEIQATQPGKSFLISTIVFVRITVDSFEFLGIGDKNVVFQLFE